MSIKPYKQYKQYKPCIDISKIINLLREKLKSKKGEEEQKELTYITNTVEHLRNKMKKVKDKRRQQQERQQQEREQQERQQQERVQKENDKRYQTERLTCSMTDCWLLTISYRDCNNILVTDKLCVMLMVFHELWMQLADTYNLLIGGENRLTYTCSQDDVILSDSFFLKGYVGVKPQFIFVESMQTQHIINVLYLLKMSFFESGMSLLDGLLLCFSSEFYGMGLTFSQDESGFGMFELGVGIQHTNIKVTPIDLKVLSFLKLIPMSYRTGVYNDKVCVDVYELIKSIYV